MNTSRRLNAARATLISISPGSAARRFDLLERAASAGPPSLVQATRSLACVSTRTRSRRSRPSCSNSAWRSSTRRIFPERVLGSSAMNSISRGYLYGAVTRLQCSCSSRTSARRRCRARTQHDERLDDVAAVGIGRSDDRRLEHRRMLEQRALDLERSDAVGARRDHVVGAADEPKVAVVVELRAVAGEIPLAAARRARLVLVLVVAA